MMKLEQTIPAGMNQQQMDAQKLVLDYMQQLKELKLQSKEDLTAMTSIIKERNAELKRLKLDNERLNQHVTNQQEESVQFRRILSEIRQKSLNGELSYDVIHGPEMASLKKDREKLLQLFTEERAEKEKLEKRCQAMSNQIIDKQKKIYQLESMFQTSEQNRLYLEALQGKERPAAKSDGLTKLTVTDYVQKISGFLADIPKRIPAWVKS